MAPKCRAADSSTCRVHGTGGMYEHLRQVSNDAINKRDFETYHDARYKMEELTDDSKAALKFFERGGVPTITQRVVGKLENVADRIMDARDNFNQSIYDTIDAVDEAKKKRSELPEGEEGPEPSVAEKISNVADRILSVRDNFNEAVYNAIENVDEAKKNRSELPEGEKEPDLTVGEKMDAMADRIFTARDNISGTITVGAEIIADRHEREIPAEIGGDTVAWSDMNPFKNGKLR